MDGVGTVYGGGKVKKDGVGVKVSVGGYHILLTVIISPYSIYWGGNLLCETTGRERQFDFRREEWDTFGFV